MIDKDAQDRGCRANHLPRIEQHAAIPGDATVAGQPSEQHAEIDAFGDRFPWADPDRGKADIGGVFEHGDTPAAIEGDVEFARQAKELAMVENVMVERAGDRAGVDQLIWVDAGEGAPGQVADIVGAGTARGQAQFVDGGQHLDRIGGADLADLQIGAGRDVDIAAAAALGYIGKPPCLMGGQDAARQAQAKHERILVRRDIEEPVEFVAEDIETLGELSGRRVGFHVIPDVERVLLALRQLLGDEFAARCDRPVLRRNMERGRVGGAGCGGRVGQQWAGHWRRIGHSDAAFVGNPGDKAFEILLLVFGKGRVLGHRAWHWR